MTNNQHSMNGTEMRYRGIATYVIRTIKHDDMLIVSVAYIIAYYKK